MSNGVDVDLNSAEMICNVQWIHFHMYREYIKRNNMQNVHSIFNVMTKCITVSVM